MDDEKRSITQSTHTHNFCQITKQFHAYFTSDTFVYIEMLEQPARRAVERESRTLSEIILRASE